MAEVTKYPAIKRPNGKLYRPRKIVAEFSYDYDYDQEAGVWVFGTHDGSLSRKLAGQLVSSYDKGLMPVDPYTTWVRRQIRHGDIRFEYDPEHGRAAVYFPELVEVGYAQAFPQESDGRPAGHQFGNNYKGKIDCLTRTEADALVARAGG